MKIIATMCAILTANLAMAAPCVLPSVCEAGRDCSPVPLRIDIGGNPPGSISTNLGAFEVVNTATAGAVTARVPMANGQNWRVVSPLDRIEARRPYGDADQTLTLERDPGGIVHARIVAMPRRYEDYAAAMMAMREFAGPCPEGF